MPHRLTIPYGYADQIRTGSTSGIHVFIYDNIFRGVDAANYLTRVIDVMITGARLA